MQWFIIEFKFNTNICNGLLNDEVDWTSVYSLAAERLVIAYILSFFI